MTSYISNFEFSKKKKKKMCSKNESFTVLNKYLLISFKVYYNGKNRIKLNLIKDEQKNSEFSM